MNRRDDELDIAGLLQLYWQRRWLLLGVTVLATALAIGWALLATEWYRAEAVLAPATDNAQPSPAGQLAGLVAFAGLGGGSTRSAEAIAILRSREFLRAFVESNELAGVLAGQLEGRGLRNGPAASPDDMQAAVALLRDRLLRVQDDGATGLVTVSLEWTDPGLAAAWVNQLVDALNESMRERTLREAAANVEFLRAELAATQVVTLQQAVGRLLESELQKLMVARGSEEAAFRVLDRADPPRLPVRPNRPVIVILGASLGLILAVLWASVAAALRR